MAAAWAIEDPFSRFPQDAPPKSYVGEVLEQSALNEPPRPVSQPQPVYPYNMRAAGLRGEVEIAFVVTETGVVCDAYVLRSNNPWFERPALDAVSKWKFKPGRANGRPVSTRMVVPILFTLNGGGRDLWTISKPQNHDKLPPEFQWDTAPRLIGIMFPVYPFELLCNGATARFKAAIAIDPQGWVVHVDFAGEAPAEFKHAVRAMFDCWRFEPARKAGQPCYAMLAVGEEFAPTGRGTVPVSEGARKILKELERKGPRIFTLAELDEVPAPISRRPAIYPRILRSKLLEGSAVIEFFIDRAGDAQLPRIVSSTHEEFGYAAAQAVANWRFAPPRKNGRPVIARVQVPFEFTLANSPQPDKD